MPMSLRGMGINCHLDELSPRRAGCRRPLLVVQAGGAEEHLQVPEQ